MKLLNKTTLPCALLLGTALFSGILWSDTKSGPKAEQSRPDRFDMMTSRLKLDDKQKAQLKPVLEKLQQNREQAMKQLEENEQKELAKVLSADQIKPVQRYLQYSQRVGANRHAEARREFKGREGQNSREAFPRPPKKLPERD